MLQWHVNVNNILLKTAGLRLNVAFTWVLNRYYRYNTIMCGLWRKNFGFTKNSAHIIIANPDVYVVFH